MIEQAPTEVRTRNRIYTTERQRRDLTTTQTLYGRGTPVSVGLTTVERDTDWEGIYAERATFFTQLGYYGEIHVPDAVARRLDLCVGDTLRLSLASQYVTEINETVTVSSAD